MNTAVGRKNLYMLALAVVAAACVAQSSAQEASSPSEPFDRDQQDIQSRQYTAPDDRERVPDTDRWLRDGQTPRGGDYDNRPSYRGLDENPRRRVVDDSGIRRNVAGFDRQYRTGSEYEYGYNDSDSDDFNLYGTSRRHTDSDDFNEYGTSRRHTDSDDFNDYGTSRRRADFDDFNDYGTTRGRTDFDDFNDYTAWKDDPMITPSGVTDDYFERHRDNASSEGVAAYSDHADDDEFESIFEPADPGQSNRILRNEPQTDFYTTDSGKFESWYRD